MTQEAHHHNALHAPPKENVFGQVLDEQSQQSARSDTRMFRLTSDASKEFEMTALENAGDSQDGLGPKEGFLEKVASILQINNGLHVNSFPWKQGQKVHHEPRGKVAGPYGLSISQDDRSIKGFVLRDEIEHHVHEEPTFNEIDEQGCGNKGSITNRLMLQNDPHKGDKDSC